MSEGTSDPLADIAKLASKITAMSTVIDMLRREKASIVETSIGKNILIGGYCKRIRDLENVIIRYRDHVCDTTELYGILHSSMRMNVSCGHSWDQVKSGVMNF
jgi:hypothetical protein